MRSVVLGLMLPVVALCQPTAVDVPASQLPGFQTPPAPVPRTIPQKAAPEWTKNASWAPKPEQLAELRAAVAETPKDRAARNRLGWVLYRTEAWADLVKEAESWRPFDPRNPQVFEYMGVGLARLGETAKARRVLGSIADVAPARVGILNRAGYLLLREGQPGPAADLFAQAIELRPDRQNNYRGLALARWTEGRHEEAWKAYEAGLTQEYHERYHDVPRVLREEATALVRAWLKVAPTAEHPAIQARAKAAGLKLEAPVAPLRITLHWETDATDVDLHVVDPTGHECFYSTKKVPSGLHLYDDLTQGLGPEVMVLPADSSVKRGTFHVGVKYFRSGPMGVSRGIVLVQRASPDGAPRVEVVPFVLLPDGAGSESKIRHLATVEL